MINRQKVEQLASIEEPHCTSIYLPTHRAGHNQEDQLRYKNALNEAANQLEGLGLNPRQIRQRLQPAWDLYEDSSFWLHQSDGLALFIGKENFDYFEVPIDFNPFVWTGPQYLLRPLLPLFSTDRIFYLLALSKNNVRFFECSRWAITPVKINDVAPANLAATSVFVSEAGNLQMHSGQGADQPPIYHGHDQTNATETAALKEFVSAIEAGLREALCEHPEPLLLAGVDMITALYKQMSANEGILAPTISGNTDEDDPALLHEKAVLALGADFFLENQLAYAEQFDSFMAEDRASAVLTEIVPAAVNGRVSALFINRDYYSWGAFDAEKHQAIVHPEQQKNSLELLDFAAKQAFLKGADIFDTDRQNLPFPTANLNAIYRY